ncbi:hypothetical protein PENTCL1PPCAC_16680, partial [Pristionchus entomophagus]
MLFLTVFVLDSTTFVINYLAARYCKGRYRSLNTPNALNARYQAKEAYELAMSMQPAFMSIYIAKTLLAVILLSFCYKMDAVLQCVPFLFPATFADREVLYFLTLTILSTFLIGWLVLKHPRFRRKIKSRWRIIQLILDLKTTEKILYKIPEGDRYFETLHSAWNEAHANTQRIRMR